MLFVNEIVHSVKISPRLRWSGFSPLQHTITAYNDAEEHVLGPWQILCLPPMGGDHRYIDGYPLPHVDDNVFKR